MPLSCRAITLIPGVILNEEKKPSLEGERGNLGGILRDNLGEGNLGSQHPSPNVKNPLPLRAELLARNYHVT